jgi:outer membrane protein assembly factor BamD (BamD/ComL family)
VLTRDSDAFLSLLRAQQFLKATHAQLKVVDISEHPKSEYKKRSKNRMNQVRSHVATSFEIKKSN